MKYKCTMLLFICSSLVIFICGCSSPAVEKILFSNLSEIRSSYYYANCEDFCVSYTGGQREKNYYMDGKHTDLVDFGVIVLKLDSGKVYNGSFQFEITSNGEKYYGELERNTYDNTYVFDLEVDFGSSAIISFYLIDADINLQLLNVVNDWQIGYKDAFNKFVDRYYENLKSRITDSKINGEFFIKIVSGSNGIDNMYWYICFIGQDGSLLASLIDVQSGEILFA